MKHRHHWTDAGVRLKHDSAQLSEEYLWCDRCGCLRYTVFGSVKTVTTIFRPSHTDTQVSKPEHVVASNQK